jgi:hypothetical protein
MSQFKSVLLPVAVLATVLPHLALACACGCGVFDVGTGTMLPTGEGGNVWLEYDYANQTENRHGINASSNANNEDQRLTTNYFTAGAQYMFTRQWGAEIQIPFWQRSFTRANESDAGDAGDDPAPFSTSTFDHSAFGDIRVKGIYTGLSDDMSAGITFGLKLPSGDFKYSNFDRDTAIGTGSTDILLGAYHQAELAGDFNWFVNGEWSHAVSTQDHYRPGDDVNVAVGSYYNGFDFGNAGKISPLLQFIGSVRQHDTGSAAATDDSGEPQSGYRRLMISPGVEYDINSIRLYGDVELPIYENVNGQQLTAPVLVKLVVGYSF